MATPQQLFLNDPSSFAALQLKTLGGNPLAGSSVRDAAFGSLFGGLGGAESPTEARNRQFLLQGLGQEAELALRGLSSSGAGSFARENLEQSRLNALLPQPGRGGGGGGRRVARELRRAAEPRAKPPPTTRTVTPSQAAERTRLEEPEFIKDLRAALQKSQEAEARQIGTGGRGDPRDVAQRARAGVGQGAFTTPLGLSGAVQPPGQRDIANPDQAFRTELNLRTQDPGSKSQIELAESIVGAFGQARIFDEQLQDLDEQFRQPIEALEEKLRRANEPDFTTQVDEFGEPVPLTEEQSQFRTQEREADARRLDRARQQLQEQRSQLENTKKLQLQRVQREFGVFESKIGAMQKMDRDSDKRSMRIFLRRSARDVADFLGTESKGGIRGFQVVMASSSSKQIVRAKALIAQGVSREEVQAALTEQQDGQ